MEHLIFANYDIRNNKKQIALLHKTLFRGIVQLIFTIRRNYLNELNLLIGVHRLKSC